MSDMPGMVMVSAVELQALKAYYEAGEKCRECTDSLWGEESCEECPTLKAEHTATDTLRRIEEGRK